MVFCGVLKKEDLLVLFIEPDKVLPALFYLHDNSPLVEIV
jgi:hypothetical protein